MGSTQRLSGFRILNGGLLRLNTAPSSAVPSIEPRFLTVTLEPNLVRIKGV